MKDLQLDAKKAFSENLKRIRKERNFTQVELADLSGLTQATLSHIEKGLRWPDYITIS